MIQGFRIHDSGSRVSVGLRVLGCRIQGLGLWGSGFRAYGFGV